MQKLVLVLTTISALVISCADNDGEPASGSVGASAGIAGSAASGGIGASSGVAGSAASAGTLHNELCLVSARCSAGTISGEFGVSCTTFSAHCEFGCAEHPAQIQVPDGQNVWDPALAAKYASDALCEASEPGAGGVGGSGAEAGGGGAAD